MFMKNEFNVPMTKELSDEINVLLKDHSKALSALYDEGFALGWHSHNVHIRGYLKGMGAVITLVGTGMLIGTLVSERVTNRKKSKEEKESK